MSNGECLINDEAPMTNEDRPADSAERPGPLQGGIADVRPIPSDPPPPAIGLRHFVMDSTFVIRNSAFPPGSGSSPGGQGWTMLESCGVVPRGYDGVLVLPDSGVHE